MHEDTDDQPVVTASTDAAEAEVIAELTARPLSPGEHIGSTHVRLESVADLGGNAQIVIISNDGPRVIVRPRIDPPGWSPSVRVEDGDDGEVAIVEVPRFLFGGQKVEVKDQRNLRSRTRTTWDRGRSLLVDLSQDADSASGFSLDIEAQRGLSIVLMPRIDAHKSLTSWFSDVGQMILYVGVPQGAFDAPASGPAA